MMFEHPYAIALFAILGVAIVSWLLSIVKKVSGVAMLERALGKRRPEYAEYIRRTNAFFPELRRSGQVPVEAKS